MNYSENHLQSRIRPDIRGHSRKNYEFDIHVQRTIVCIHQHKHQQQNNKKQTLNVPDSTFLLRLSCSSMVMLQMDSGKGPRKWLLAKDKVFKEDK